jgi:hypothetical protein
MFGFKKSPSMSSSEAAEYLSQKSGVKKNWTYSLEDNRRGKHLKEIGLIPFTNVGRKVFYRRTDIEAVAHELRMCKLCGFKKPSRLF